MLRQFPLSFFFMFYFVLCILCVFSTPVRQISSGHREVARESFYVEFKNAGGKLLLVICWRESSILESTLSDVLKVGGKAPCSRGNMLEGKLHKFIGYRESSIVESSYQKIGWRESSCSKSICWRESSMFYEVMLYVGGKAPY